MSYRSSNCKQITCIYIYILFDQKYSSYQKNTTRFTVYVWPRTNCDWNAKWEKTKTTKYLRIPNNVRTSFRSSSPTTLFVLAYALTFTNNIELADSKSLYDASVAFNWSFNIFRRLLSPFIFCAIRKQTKNRPIDRDIRTHNSPRAVW